MIENCQKITLFLVFCLFTYIAILTTSCSKSVEKPEKDTNNTTFEQFLEHFPPQSSVIEGINAENGADFQGGIKMNTAYFQEFLQNNSFLDKDLQRIKFDTNLLDNRNFTYHYAFSLSLSSRFYSLVISANTEGDPTHKWEYYLLNYTKEGKFIDGILLSYRNSYESEESTANLFQSEYRYVRFVSKNQLYFLDVNYDNSLTAINPTDKQFMLINSGEGDMQYCRESWYQIQEDGSFKRIKVVEKDKKEAKP
jgi:hypothetical protein